jgi:hypothetical protein
MPDTATSWSCGACHAPLEGESDNSPCPVPPEPGMGPDEGPWFHRPERRRRDARHSRPERGATDA